MDKFFILTSMMYSWNTACITIVIKREKNTTHASFQPVVYFIGTVGSSESEVTLWWIAINVYAHLA